MGAKEEAAAATVPVPVPEWVPRWPDGGKNAELASLITTVWKRAPDKTDRDGAADWDAPW